MFRVGDRVKIINPICTHYRDIGIITEPGLAYKTYTVSFFSEKYSYGESEIERVDDMDISERLSEVIKENQNLKQQLSEQNIKLNKIQADVRREQGVSDEEFGEAIKHFSIIDEDKRYEIWGLINYFDLFAQTSLSKFVNKYKEYKDKQNEIKVGDEVIVKPNGYNAVVIAFATQIGQLTVFTTEHNTFEVLVSDVEKTGRHFDEVETLLSKLKGGK